MGYFSGLAMEMSICVVLGQTIYLQVPCVCVSVCVSACLYFNSKQRKHFFLDVYKQEVEHTENCCFLLLLGQVFAYR